MAKPFETARRIVIKTGSALIAEKGEPRREWLTGLAADIADLRAAGREVVWVSSGAVALGRSHLGKRASKRLEEKQAAAALGQPLLMSAIADALRPHGLHAAQSLLTLEDTERRRRWLNARATLDTLLAAGVVPIINENDTVATEEIRYGDNDRLAARVAQMLSADVLVLLSDVDGLYTADPRKDPAAEHIAELHELTEAHDAMAGTANAETGVGSGGMATKLAAARIAWGAGCATAITLGDREHPLGALRGGERATWIIPSISPATARQTWLKGHLTPEGAILVDAGAVRALKKGSSLLAVGVTGVEGRFEKGAAVAIKGPGGEVVAKGVTAYDAANVQRIAGAHTNDIEKHLGYRGRPAVIHRDDLVLD
ncbi:glutamate 5-kinase [Henriciella aquimarina]|uniref:glutamate 5-kinase n=1 Tax=Henriciella aquimarina TaxID=545261 RepID=UPI000A06F83E|nr:glutamate 5-kinase [Henriciella aquimarina]